MRELYSDQNGFWNPVFWAAIFILAVCLAIPSVCAEEKPKNSHAKPITKNDKIHITADRLISNTTTGYAEFVGNVRATQGDAIITSDSLKIYYKKNEAAKQTPAVGQESIQKIVAHGNVRIKFDNRVAESQQAVYNTETNVMVLSGDRSKITSGNNTISGKKITYYRTDGRITVEGGSKERVEAMFYTGGKGLK